MLSFPEAGEGKNGVPLPFLPTPDWEGAAALWLTTEGKAGMRRWLSDASLAIIPPVLSNTPNFILCLHISPSNPYAF